MQTLISTPKKKNARQNMTDIKRIVILTGAIQKAKKRLMELNKYEKSTEIISYLDDVLERI